MFKWPLITILVILLSIVQTSFLHVFELLRSNLNVILILIVLTTFMIGYRRGILIAIVSGLTLDLFSPFFYGAITIALIVPIPVIYLLFKKILARKSLYSLTASVIVYTIVYHGALILLSTIPWWFDWNELAIRPEYEYLKNAGIQIVVHTILIGTLYIFMKLLSVRFRANFLMSERI